MLQLTLFKEETNEPTRNHSFIEKSSAMKTMINTSSYTSKTKNCFFFSFRFVFTMCIHIRFKVKLLFYQIITAEEEKINKNSDENKKKKKNISIRSSAVIVCVK